MDRSEIPFGRNAQIRTTGYQRYLFPKSPNSTAVRNTRDIMQIIFLVLHETKPGLCTFFFNQKIKLSESLECPRNMQGDVDDEGGTKLGEHVQEMKVHDTDKNL